MPLEELTLTAYQCPISITKVDSEEAKVNVGHYIAFGNLRSVFDEMKIAGITPYPSDVDFIMRRDLHQSTLYKCKRLDDTRFYDLSNRENAFHSTPHNPIRINFFTYDQNKARTPNELREEMIKQLDYIKSRSDNSRDIRNGILSMIGGGTLGAWAGSYVNICYLPSAGPCDTLGSFLLGMLGAVLSAFIYLGVHSVLGLNEKNNIAFSNIRGEIIDTNHLEVSEHPELRDIFRALETATDLEIKTPQNPEFYKICREVQRKLSERIGTRMEVDRYALKLYSEKVRNWNNKLREKNKY